MPVSGDTLLRLIRAASLKPFTPPRVIGIDDWAWRRGQRYGTIICDLERNRVIDLLPDRNADTVAAWLKLHPGVEIIARDRGGVYADGARRGAPDAIQVADRWHLLSNLGDALRTAVGRHRQFIKTAGQAVAKIKNGRPAECSEAERAGSTKLEALRETRRVTRHDSYAEIRRLRDQGMSPGTIAPHVGMQKRSVERWLAAGGEPEHHRKRSSAQIIDPFRDYLVRLWQEGCHTGEQLWREIKEQGFRGGRATVARWAATCRKRPCAADQTEPNVARWKLPSRRRCAWLLSEELHSLDADDQSFLGQLFELAPELALAANLARRFCALMRGGDDRELRTWLTRAATGAGSATRPADRRLQSWRRRRRNRRGYAVQCYVVTRRFVRADHGCDTDWRRH